MRLRAGEKGCALVDLIEGVWADHQALGIAVDHGLGEGEQRFARAVDRQYVVCGIQPASWHAKAALAPAGNALAQFGQAQGGRIYRQFVQVGGQCLADEVRRAVLGFTDRQGDRRPVGGRLHAGEQGAELFEGVGLQLGEGVVHDDPTGPL